MCHGVLWPMIRKLRSLALELQDVARFGGRCYLKSQLLENATDLGDLLCIADGKALTARWRLSSRPTRTLAPMIAPKVVVWTCRRVAMTDQT